MDRRGRSSASASGASLPVKNFPGASIGNTRRVEIGHNLVSDATATNIQDFQTIAQKMIRSLIQLPQIQRADKPLTLALNSCRTNE